MASNKKRFERLSVISLIILLPLVLVLAGCSKKNNSSNPVAPPAGSNQIIMQNTSYIPQTLSVNKGTTVTWTNKDPYDHTVTSGTPGHPSGLFDSGIISPNGKFSYTFDSTGTYAYYCKIHLDKMTGTIIVK